MNKRIIAVLLTLCLALTMLPIFASAEEDTPATSGTWGENIVWEFHEDTSTLVITGEGPIPDCSAGVSAQPWGDFSLQIKSIVMEPGTTGTGITSIGMNAFGGMQNLETAELSQDLTSIGEYAFYGSGLKNVTLPASLTTIGKQAFSNTGLTSITIPGSVKTVGQMAFYLSGQLTSVTLEEGVEVIDSAAFQSCMGLCSVTLPDSLTTIKDSAFESSPLTEIVIPSGVDMLESRAFAAYEDNPTLEKITFTGDAPSIAANCFQNVTATAYYPANNDTWNEEVMQNYGGNLTWKSYNPNGDIIINGEHEHGRAKWSLTSNGVLTISGNRSLQDKNTYEWAEYADMVTAVVIEDGITSIPERAFSGYSNLEKVDIGNTVEVIKSGAFRNCTKLSSVTIPASVTEMENSVFYGCSSLTAISFEADSKLETIGQSIFESSGLSAVTLPSSLRVISSYAFRNCLDLTTAMIPEGVEEIDPNAFQDCSNLRVVGLPSTLTIIRNDAFLRCLDIERLEIASHTLRYVHGTAVFGGHPALTTVVFNDGVKYVPSRAFEDCTKLEEVVLPDSIEAIEDSAFAGCTTLRSVDLPDSIVTIEKHAFARSGLTDVSIPENVTVINGFASCPDLATVTLGENATEIAACAFSNCTNLVEINMENIESIGFEAFQGASSLTSVELDSVETIGYSAFQDCTNLQRVILSQNLNIVEHNVFYGCSSLTSVYVPSVDASYDSYVFNNTSNVVVFGETGSTTQDYAKESNLPFVPLHDPDHTYDEGTIAHEGHCGDPSIRRYACNDCDKTADLEFYAYEHTYGESVIIKEATCTELGEEEFTCTVCGHTLVENIPMLDHTYTTAVTAPTCSQKGYTTYTCTVCDYVYSSDEVPALGHVYENGACTVCGRTEPSTTRVYGNTRYETAYAVANELKAVLGVEKFDTIIVACGPNFPDALSGSYLAAIKDAPILLAKTNNDTLLAYIQENLSDDGLVYILGSDVVVSKAFEDSLKAENIKVERLAGATRYLTNLAILEEAGITGNEMLISTSMNYADSLSASSTGLPILLINNSKKDLTTEQKEFLAQRDSWKFYILGSEAAVCAEFEDVLGDYGDVERVYGDVRESTSIAIAKAFCKAPENMVLAYSQDFPDGLCGGVLAYNLNAPLVLARTSEKIEKLVGEYVQEYGISQGIILGSSKLISDDTTTAIFQK